MQKGRGKGEIPEKHEPGISGRREAVGDLGGARALTDAAASSGLADGCSKNAGLTMPREPLFI